jgi:chemotaxis protein methyltransferase CheR
MSVQEFKQRNPGSFPGGVQIIGTDISTTMLEHCKYGHYDSLALSRGLSAERKRQFFEPGDNGMWKVKDAVKSMVSFRPINLLNSYSLMGRFDIVFIRNVLIYFSPEIKKQILSQIHGVLNNKGYLFLGASESLSGLNNDFDMLRCNPGIVYQKQ